MVDTARDYLYYNIEDDNTIETGGIAFIGETLRDFLVSIEVSFDTDMDTVNEILKYNGIKQII